MSTLVKKRLKKLKKLGKKRAFSLIFSLVFLMLFLLIIINFSDIFSSLITKKNSLFYTPKIENESYLVYAVSLDDFKTQAEAENYAEEVKQNGGAGYVYHNGEYFVFASSYPSLIEAKEIKENLVLLGYNSRIVNLKVDSFLIDYKGENSALILESIKQFRNTYNLLQETSIKFDKNEITQKQANSVFAQILTKLSTLENKIKKLNQAHDLPLKQHIIVPIKQVKQLLENLLYYANENNFEYSANIKSACIDIVFINKNLIENIKKL